MPLGLEWGRCTASVAHQRLGILGAGVAASLGGQLLAPLSRELIPLHRGIALLRLPSLLAAWVTLLLRAKEDPALARHLLFSPMLELRGLAEEAKSRGSGHVSHDSKLAADLEVLWTW